jgi:uncharacterized membrane protein YfcA
VSGRDRLVAALSGAAAGFFGGLFGVGGGAILVPLLTQALGFTQHEAHATSLAVTLFTAIAAGAVYAAHGNVAWTTGIVIGIGSALGAPLGARLAHRLSARALLRAFAVLLLLLAARMFWAPAPGPPLVFGVARVVVELLIGFGAGVAAGFMGIGGGMVVVPGSVLLLGMSQQLAQGTSLLSILGASPSGTIAHARRGAVKFHWVPWLAAGSVVVGPTVSWFVQRVPRELLTRCFAAFLVANAVYSLWRSRTPKPA